MQFIKRKKVEYLFEEFKNFLPELKNKGYIFENMEDAILLEKRILDNYQLFSNKESYTISISITSTCNLCCSYCFEKEQINNKLTYKLSEEMLDNIFEYIRNYHYNNKIILELYGGEPLMEENRNLIIKILEYCNKENISKIVIISNGTYLDKYASILSNYKNINFVIQVTIDGSREIHNSRRCNILGKGYYDRIISNIKMLLNYKNIKFQIRTNVDKNNLFDIEKLYNDLEKNLYEFDNWMCYATPVSGIEKENSVDEYELITHIENIGEFPWLNKTAGLHLLDYLYASINGLEYDILPKLTFCESCREKYINFGYDGNLYACSELVGIEKYKVGTYYPKFEIYEHEYNKWKKNNVLSNENCKNCVIRFLCGGGCAKEKYEKYKDYTNSEKNLDCDIRYKVIEKYFDYVRRELKLE